MKAHTYIRILDSVLWACKIILVALIVCLAVSLSALVASCRTSKTTSKTDSEVQYTGQVEQRSQQQVQIIQAAAETTAVRHENTQSFIVDFERWEFGDTAAVSTIAKNATVAATCPKSRAPGKPPDSYTKGRVTYIGTDSEVVSERRNTDTDATATRQADRREASQSAAKDSSEHTKQPMGLWQKALVMAVVMAISFVASHLFWRRKQHT